VIDGVFGTQAGLQKLRAKAVTRLEDLQGPDAIYDIASREFGETELIRLTLGIAAINNLEPN
jgi:hypothetical protein